VPCYQRRCPTLSDAQLAQLIAYQQLQQNRQKNAETAQPVLWLLTSSEGARNLCEMVQAHATEYPDLFAWMLHQTALVPHPRIAEQARALGFIDIRLSGSGDDNILSALRQL
jgi:uroporphyrinogen-III synthase